MIPEQHKPLPNLGTIYKIFKTSGPEGTNLLKLIPVPISSDKLTPLVYSDMSSAGRGISSPANVSIQTPLSSSITVPSINVPILQQVSTGQYNSTHTQIVAVESSTSSFRCNAVQIDQPLLQNITVASNQGDKSYMVGNENSIPAPVTSPALPSGHHLQIPAHAEVKSVPASSLPLAIQQKILAAAGASGTASSKLKMPTVIFVSPVNTVQSTASKRLPPLYSKPHLSNSAPISLAASQELRTCPAADGKTSQQSHGSPKKWIVHGSPQLEAPCLVPVRSSNSMASKILKTLSGMKTTENSLPNMTSSCASSPDATKTMTLKENALVMYNGKVYLLAKKGLDVITTQTENRKSSTMKTPENPGDKLLSDSVNQMASKVVGVVLSKSKSTSNADHMNTCINPEILLQPNLKETDNLPQVLIDLGNQESKQTNVSTSGNSTDETSTMKTNDVALDENYNLFTDETVLIEKNEEENETMKTRTKQYGSPVTPNVEEMPSSSKCNTLARDILRKSMGISKEIKVCLERIPLDTIKGCRRETTTNLKSGIATGKEIDKVTYETKLHEIRKEGMACSKELNHLSRASLRKRFYIFKEIQVCLERIPSDVMKGCSRMTEEYLKYGDTSDKEEDRITSKTTVHQMRKEGMACSKELNHLTRASLRISFNISKEIQVCLERLPLDVMKGCSRMTEEYLKCGIPSGKQDDRIRFKTKVHEMRKEGMACSKELNNLTRASLRKSLKISKEIQVCLERLPFDVMKGCCRMTEEYLKFGIASGKEDDRITCKTKVHEMREEGMVCSKDLNHLTRATLRKGFNIFKELKVSLERLPLDVMKGCSRMREECLKYGIPSGKEDDTITFKTKVHEMRKEGMVYSNELNHLTSASLRKSFNIFKEIQVCLERLPLDVMKGCSRMTGEYLKYGIPFGKEEERITFTTKVHEMRKEGTIKLKPDICKKRKPKLEGKIGNVQRSKSKQKKRNILIVARTCRQVLHRPMSQNAKVLQQVVADLNPGHPKKRTSKMLNNMENKHKRGIKEECGKNGVTDTASNHLPVLYKIPSQNSSILQEVTPHVEPSSHKEIKLNSLDNMGNTKRRECIKESTPDKDMETANTSLPMLDHTTSQSSNLLQQLTAKVHKERRSNVLDNFGNIRRRKSVEEWTLKTASSSCPMLDQNPPQSSNILQQIAVAFKPEVHNKRKSTLPDNLKNAKKMKTIEECTLNKDMEELASNSPPMFNQTHSQSSAILQQLVAYLKLVVPKEKTTQMSDNMITAKRNKSEEACTLSKDQKNVSSGLTIFNQTPSHSLNLFQNVTATLKPELKKEKSKELEYIGRKERCKCDESTPSACLESASTSQPILQQSPKQSSYLLQQVMNDVKPVLPNKRKSKILDNMQNPETIDNTKQEFPSNKDLATASTSLPILHRTPTSSLNVLQMEPAFSSNTFTMKNPKMVPSPQMWKSATSSSEKHVGSSYDFLPIPQLEYASSPSTSTTKEIQQLVPNSQTWKSYARASSDFTTVPVLESDETIRDDKITKLKELLRERECALEAIMKAAKP